jgi:beta-phosphoglucomutase
MIRELKTILFDFDGVVIDSEPLHAKAKKIILDRYKINYPSSIFDEFKGKTDKVFFDFVSRKLGNQSQSSVLLENSKKKVFEEIINELELINGFLPFLGKVKEKKIQTALVSSTSLYSLALVDSLYHISGMFDLVITEVDTELHKPYPDPYLKALEKLRAETGNSIVIEDSPNGIISAKRAGCFVYAITSSFTRHILLEAGADVVVGSFNDLTMELGF